MTFIIDGQRCVPGAYLASHGMVLRDTSPLVVLAPSSLASFPPPFSLARIKNLRDKHKAQRFSGHGSRAAILYDLVQPGLVMFASLRSRGGTHAVCVFSSFPLEFDNILDLGQLARGCS